MLETLATVDAIYLAGQIYDLPDELAMNYTGNGLAVAIEVMDAATAPPIEAPKSTPLDKKGCGCGRGRKPKPE